MNFALKTIAYGIILFYTTGQPYDIFSNTTAIPLQLNLNGNTYVSQSTEAVFQGLKGLGNPHRHKDAVLLIQDTKTPLSQLRDRAQRLGFNSLGKQEIYNEPYQNSNLLVKEEVMYQLLLAKATQHPEIGKALLETGDNEIIENTFLNKKYNDEFWGNGHSQKGYNALGKAWMRVRDTLNTELKTTGNIPKRTGISDNLAAVLRLLDHRPGSQYDGSVLTLESLEKVQSATTVDALYKSRGLNLKQPPQSPQSPHTKRGSSSSSAIPSNVPPTMQVPSNVPARATPIHNGARHHQQSSHHLHSKHQNHHRSHHPVSRQHIATPTRITPTLNVVVAPHLHQAKSTSAFDRVRRATGAQYVAVINDIRIPNRKVLRLTFNTGTEARRFAARNGNAWINGRDVYLGPGRANSMFRQLNIASHGRNHPRPMWQALLWEARHG